MGQKSAYGVAPPAVVLKYCEKTEQMVNGMPAYHQGVCIFTHAMYMNQKYTTSSLALRTW